MRGGGESCTVWSRLPSFLYDCRLSGLVALEFATFAAQTLESYLGLSASPYVSFSSLPLSRHLTKKTQNHYYLIYTVASHYFSFFKEKSAFVFDPDFLKMHMVQKIVLETYATG